MSWENFNFENVTFMQNSLFLTLLLLNNKNALIIKYAI